MNEYLEQTDEILIKKGFNDLKLYTTKYTSFTTMQKLKYKLLSGAEEKLITEVFNNLKYTTMEQFKYELITGADWWNIIITEVFNDLKYTTEYASFTTMQELKYVSISGADEKLITEVFNIMKYTTTEYASFTNYKNARNENL